MKTTGQIVAIIFLIAWVSTGAIKPLQMFGDVLAMLGGAADSVQTRIDTPPQPKP